MKPYQRTAQAFYSKRGSESWARTIALQNSDVDRASSFDIAHPFGDRAALLASRFKDNSLSCKSVGRSPPLHLPFKASFSSRLTQGYRSRAKYSGGLATPEETDPFPSL